MNIRQALDAFLKYANDSWWLLLAFAVSMTALMISQNITDPTWAYIAATCSDVFMLVAKFFMGSFIGGIGHSDDDRQPVFRVAVGIAFVVA